MASEVKEIIQSIQSSKKSEFLSGCSRLLGSVIGLDMEKTGKDGIYSLILQGDENKDQTLIGEGLAQAIKAYSGSIEGVYPIAILDRMLLSYEADRYADTLYAALSNYKQYLVLLQKGENNEFGAEIIRMLTVFLLFSSGSQSMEDEIENLTISQVKSKKSKGKSTEKIAKLNEVTKKRIDGKDILQIFSSLSSSNFLTTLLESVLCPEITSPARCSQALESLCVLYTSILSNMLSINVLKESVKMDSTVNNVSEEFKEKEQNIYNKLFVCPAIVILIPEFREKISSWFNHAKITKDFNLGLNLFMFMKVALLDIYPILKFIQLAQDNANDETDENVCLYNKLISWLNIPIETDAGIMEDDICSFIERILEMGSLVYSNVTIPKKGYNNFVSAYCEMEYLAKIMLGEEAFDINDAEKNLQLEDENDLTSGSEISSTSSTRSLSQSNIDVENALTNVMSTVSNANQEINRSKYRENLSFENGNVLKKAIIELSLYVKNEHHKYAKITTALTTRTGILRYKFVLGAYNLVAKLPIYENEKVIDNFIGGMPSTASSNEAICSFLNLNFTGIDMTYSHENKIRRNEKDKRITKDKRGPETYYYEEEEN